MTFSDETLKLLEGLSYLATLLGIPTAIGVFLFEKRRARQAQELEAHQLSNDRYFDYLGLCLSNPDLNAFEFRPDDKAVLDSGLEVGTIVMFTMLVCMIETAFLRYRQFRSAAQERQWEGWLGYAREWAERPDFRAAWPLVRNQFDSELVCLIQRLVDRATPRLPQDTLA